MKTFQKENAKILKRHFYIRAKIKETVRKKNEKDIFDLSDEELNSI